MTVIAMSRTEIDRMSVLQDLAANRIKVTEAATLMSIGRRQVFRLAKAYAQRGPEALVSRKRGRPSNRAYPADLRDAAIGIIRERYPDFGPTLAAEKLAELHDIHLARETVRQWMIAAGLWKDRRARLKPVHQPRYRRDCLGELIQIDGSEHWWFEARGPQCTLLVYIDDATSRLMHLQFVESESTFDYFAATRAYLERHATPSREPDINPNPQKGGYPAPDRVTFLNGSNRDFPKRRRQSVQATTDAFTLLSIRAGQLDLFHKVMGPRLRILLFIFVIPLFK
jgi:Homeodomain-like domain